MGWPAPYLMALERRRLEELIETGAIATDQDGPVRARHADGRARRRGLLRQVRGRLSGDGGEIDVLELERERPRAGAGDLEELIHERGEPACLPEDHRGARGEAARGRRPVRARGAPREGLRLEHERGQRRLELVRRHGEEAVAHGESLGELVEQAIALLLGALARGDVLDDVGNVVGRAGGVAHQRGHRVDPHGLAVATEKALLPRVAVDLSAVQELTLGPALFPIVGVDEVQAGHPRELLPGVADDLAEAIVDQQEPPLAAHVRHADRGLLERGAEAALALRQRGVGARALDRAGGPGGDQPEQGDLLEGERARDAGPDVEDADHPAVDEQRRTGEALDVLPEDGVHHVGLGDVVHDDRRAPDGDTVRRSPGRWGPAPSRRPRA